MCLPFIFPERLFQTQTVESVEIPTTMSSLASTWTSPCCSVNSISFVSVFLFQISMVPFLSPQMMESLQILMS